MTATTKFYTGFIIALVLVITVAFYAGYRAGNGARAHAVTHGSSAAAP